MAAEGTTTNYYEEKIPTMDTDQLSMVSKILMQISGFLMEKLYNSTKVKNGSDVIWDELAFWILK